MSSELVPDSVQPPPTAEVRPLRRLRVDDYERGFTHLVGQLSASAQAAGFASREQFQEQLAEVCQGAKITE